MKPLLYIIIGGVIVFIVLKFFASKPVASDSKTVENFRILLNTDEANKLLQTPELTNVLLTSEFKQLAKGISDEYLKTITKNLLG